MTERTARLLREALELSEPERQQLITELLGITESRDHIDMDPSVEAAWRAEVIRRREEVRSGKVPTVPWNEVQTRLAARLHGRSHD